MNITSILGEKKSRLGVNYNFLIPPILPNPFLLEDQKRICMQSSHIVYQVPFFMSEECVRNQSVRNLRDNFI